MYPEDLRYTEDHEWVRNQGSECTVGITDYAAEQLGDITYIEPPNIGVKLARNAEAATVESVKAASDLYAPVAGVISEVNTALEERPELVNESPYDEGWFFKMTDIEPSDLDSLMDAASYEKFIKENS